MAAPTPATTMASWESQEAIDVRRRERIVSRADAIVDPGHTP
jgi:hypothetical protein